MLPNIPREPNHPWLSITAPDWHYCRGSCYLSLTWGWELLCRKHPWFLSTLALHHAPDSSFLFWSITRRSSCTMRWCGTTKRGRKQVPGTLFSGLFQPKYPTFVPEIGTHFSQMEARSLSNTFWTMDQLSERRLILDKRNLEPKWRRHIVDVFMQLIGLNKTWGNDIDGAVLLHRKMFTLRNVGEVSQLIWPNFAKTVSSLNYVIYAVGKSLSLNWGTRPSSFPSHSDKWANCSTCQSWATQWV